MCIVFLSSYWNPCICIYFMYFLQHQWMQLHCIMMDTQFVFSVVSKILVLGRSLTKVSQRLIYPLPCCHSNWLPWQWRWNLRWNVSSGESAACMLVHIYFCAHELQNMNPRTNALWKYEYLKCKFLFFFQTAWNIFFKWFFELYM